MIPQDFNLVKDGKPFKKTAYVVQLRFDNAEIMEFVQKRKKFLTSMQEGNNYQVSLPKAVEVVEEQVEDIVNNENARTEIDTAEDAPLDEEQAELL